MPDDKSGLEVRLLALEWLMTSLFALTCVADAKPHDLLGKIQMQMLQAINERLAAGRSADFVGQTDDLGTAVDRLVGMVGLRIGQLQGPISKG